MAKAATQLRINPTNLGKIMELQNDLVTENTSTDTGVFRRFALSLDIISRYQNTIVPKSKLKDVFIEANMVAYPKQDYKSANMWAGKAISGLVKSGIAEELDKVAE